MELQPAVLFEAVMDDTAACYTDTSTSGFAAQVLRRTILKKCSDSRLKDAGDRAIDQFIDRARSPIPIVEGLEFARGFLHQSLWAIEPEELVRGMRPGPGSSIQMFQKSTSCYMKIAHGRPTVSSFDAYKTYLYLLENYDPCWYAAEILRRKSYGAPVVVNHNRVTTVPKTNEIDRVIAVEPTINSILQQGVKSCLETRLSALGIDLGTQPDINRALARKGSLDGSLSTVDFSAASDSISRALVTSIFPKDVAELVLEVSSPNFQVRGELLSNERIALSMGNAITFPLQTFVFLSLVYQVYQKRGIPFRVGDNVAVFGDDVILDTDACADFLALAERVGFTPNPEKTFSSGEFRESCGADWLCGRNVRGVYCKTLKDLGSVVSLRNQLAAWSMRHMCPLSKTLRYLDRYLCRRGYALRVPLSAPIDSGIRVLKGQATFDRELYCLTVPYLCVLPPKKRPARKYSRVHPGFVTLGHLLGGLRSGMLCERPLSGTARSKKPFHFYMWGAPIESERWMYDYSRTSSGIVA